jgi:hypothetical protein
MPLLPCNTTQQHAQSRKNLYVKNLRRKLLQLKRNDSNLLNTLNTWNYASDTTATLIINENGKPTTEKNLNDQCLLQLHMNLSDPFEHDDYKSQYGTTIWRLTMPLRASAFAYDERKRGVIRMPFLSKRARLGVRRRRSILLLVLCCCCRRRFFLRINCCCHCCDSWCYGPRLQWLQLLVSNHPNTSLLYDCWLKF